MSYQKYLGDEFDNFMCKVTEVNKIVKKLASENKTEQQIGCLEADKYLNESGATLLEKIDEKDVKLKIKSNRTVINKRAIAQPEPGMQATMSQEAFMAEVERDADQRYKNRLIRQEKAETFRKQAKLAFNRGEYELAYTRYTKALEQIKDHCTTYLDRALTQINMKLYEKALQDITWAMKLKEDSIRAWLLQAKAHFMLGQLKDFQEDIKEAKERNPKQIEFIDEYVEEIQKKAQEEAKKQ